MHFIAHYFHVRARKAPRKVCGEKEFSSKYHSNTNNSQLTYSCKEFRHWDRHCGTWNVKLLFSFEHISVQCCDHAINYNFWHQNSFCVLYLLRLCHSSRSQALAAHCKHLGSDSGEICGGLSGCAACFCLSKIDMHSHSNFDDGDEILKSSLKTEYQNHIFAVYLFQLWDVILYFFCSDEIGFMKFNIVRA
jgi:hypothetical protein